MPPIKTQLQSQLDEILAKNQTHFQGTELIRAVQSLKEEVDSHYQLNDRGMMRPLFAAERDQLSNQYLKLIKIANNTVDRNRNVIPTAEKAAAQIKAEANASKPKGPVVG